MIADLREAPFPLQERVKKRHMLGQTSPDGRIRYPTDATSAVLSIDSRVADPED